MNRNHLDITLIQALFPLQYFVPLRHKNHDNFIERLHYDDVFRHMFDTKIMPRRFTFESDIDVLRRLHFIVETLFVMISVTI